MFPGFHTVPTYWSTVVIGGHRVLCVLREVDGMKIEGTWDEQKPTGTSGASFNWKGLKPAGPHKLTFETARYPGVTPAQCEDDMRALHEMMLPSPNLSAASTPKAAPTSADFTAELQRANAAVTQAVAASRANTAEGLMEQARQAYANLNDPAKAADPTAGTTGDSATPKKAEANPGPRPPTLSIENGFVNYVGTTAVSLKSFEVKPTKTNSLQFIIELVPQKALAKAGTGLAPAKSPDQPGAGIGTAGGNVNAAQAASTAGDRKALAAGAGT